MSPSEHALHRDSTVAHRNALVLFYEGRLGIPENKGTWPKSIREHGNIVEIKRELRNILGLKRKPEHLKKLWNVFSVSVKAAEETKKPINNSIINWKC